MLVIIGLLVGGVVVGDEMIHQSEVRGVFAEVQRFTTAARTFREKYGCIPGDCPNASTFGLGPNGNGNANVDMGWCGSITNDQTTAGNAELFLFWQHLGAAGLINGTFTGQAGAANALTSTIGTNVPSSRLAGGGYSVLNIPSNTLVCYGALFTGADYTNAIIFGAQRAADQTNGAIITGAQAFSLDKKYDDGAPGTGRVITYTPAAWSSTYNCTNSANPTNSSYTTTATSPNCFLVFNHAL